MQIGSVFVRASLLCAVAVAGSPRATTAQDLPAEVVAVLKQRAGRWEIRNDVLGAGGGVDRVTKETQQVSFIINDQILEIRGFIEDHEDYRGFLLFNPLIGKYLLTTIDRTNNKVDLTAERDAPDRFTSAPVTMPGGATVIIRRVFTTVEADRMEGYLEVSPDGGTTWRRIYNQSARRVGGD